MDTDDTSLCRGRSGSETTTDLRATTQRSEQPQDTWANGWDP